MDHPDSFTDSRGTIKDLYVAEDVSVTLVEFTEGAVRGNHLHALSTQYDTLLKGKLLCSRNGNEFIVYTPGEQIIHKPNDKHAYKALAPSLLLSVCFGKRIGTHYEEDTYRLPDNEKLL